MTSVPIPALAFGLMLASVLTPCIGKATVIAYDGFNTYAVGDLAPNNGGTGWTGAWTSATAFNDVVAGGLSYSSTGITINGGLNSMQKSTGGGNVNSEAYFSRAFTSTSSSEVWMSFLFQNNGTTFNGDDFLYFYLSDDADVANSGGIVLSGTNGFGVRITDSATSTTNSAGGAPTQGSTFLVVARLSGDGAASATNYDRMEFWLNPTSITLGTATASVDLDFGISSFDTFGVRANAIDASDTFKVDELRIGETKLDVIPEPSVISVFAIGTLALALRRRSTRHFIPFGNI